MIGTTSLIYFNHHLPTYPDHESQTYIHNPSPLPLSLLITIVIIKIMKDPIISNKTPPKPKPTPSLPG